MAGVINLHERRLAQPTLSDYHQRKVTSALGDCDAERQSTNLQHSEMQHSSCKVL